MAISGFVRSATLAVLGFTGALTFAAAQCPTSPSYSPDFSANQTCLSLNGNNSTATGSPSFAAPATQQSSVSNVLRLTANQGGWATSAWYSAPQPITNGFSTTFAFQVGNASTYNADGFAFVIQNSAAGPLALGPPGCGIGFGSSTLCAASNGITNSVAIEFNTYNNGPGVDPSADDVTIQNCGSGQNRTDSACSLGSKDLTGTISLADGAVHVATITYTASTLSNCGAGAQTCSTLDVVLDGTDLFPGGVPFDISSIGLTNATALVGFTAGTGGGNDDQDIVSWTFTPTGHSDTGNVTPGQTAPTDFPFNGGFSEGSPTTGYDFNVLQTTSNQTLQMVVTAIPISQTACNALVNKSPQFTGAQCFVFQNGGGQGNDTSVLFEVTCPASGSCGSAGNPFFADLGTNFSFNCAPVPPIENLPLQCGTPFTQPFSFGFPNLTSVTGLPSVGFLKGEGPDAVHPCSPDPSGTVPLFASNQIESFSIGDTSGGAKAGSSGTMSCWVMTYQTQNETPGITITQPASGATYTQGQSDASTVANYTCSAVNAGTNAPAGPFLTIASCTGAQTPGSSVASGSPFDTSTLGPHTFTVQTEDSATNTNQQSVSYTVVSPAAISGPSAATFSTGSLNSVVFNATGYPVPTFTESGALPAGVTFTDNRNGTATLAGNPTVSGVFPITVKAQNGVGSPAILALTLTVAGSAPSAGTKCNGVYQGTFNGSITVSAGQTCMFQGGGVTGNLVQNGGTLIFNHAVLGGNLQVNGGTFSIGSGATIKGNVAVLEPTISTVGSQICSSSVAGNLQVQESVVPVSIGSGASCPGNIIGGNLSIVENKAPTAIYGNQVRGNVTDQENKGATQIFSNAIGGSLNCTSNSSISGGGNTATKKLGQCSKF